MIKIKKIINVCSLVFLNLSFSTAMGMSDGHAEVVVCDMHHNQNENADVISRVDYIVGDNNPQEAEPPVEAQSVNGG